MEFGTVLGILGAVIAAGVSAAACCVTMCMIGQAAAGVVTEDPSKFGQTLVLQAIGSTAGIYGFLMGFLILSKTLAMADAGTMGINAGLYLLACSLPVGVVGAISAIYQGRVLVSGVILIGKRPGELAKALIYAAMIETFAVFMLLVSFLMYNGI